MDFLMSVLTGGATGIIGSIISKAVGIFEAYQRRQEKVLEFEHELKLLDRQAAIKAAETESEVAITRERSSAELRQASYQHDMADGGKASRWVVNVLRLIRPAITLVLVMLVGVVFFFTADRATQSEIISAIIYMSSSAVLWWFGDRTMGVKK